jgi:glycosyltransferase involved in cell wall biosynthesis
MWSIVHVLTSFGVGGGERVALDLAIGQRARGHEVCVVSLAPAPDGAMAEEFIAAGIPVERVAKRPGVDPTLVPRLVHVLRGRRADVVHTHNPLPLIYAVPAARLIGAAAVHTKHGYNKGSWGQALLRRGAGRLVHAFVAVSDATAKAAIAQHDVPTRRLHTITNGIRLDRYTPDPDARAAMRVELGLGDAFVIGTVGRLDPSKNQAMMIRALAPRLSSQLRLVIVGDGPLRDDIHAEVARLPEPRWVVLAGRRMDVPRIMPAFDVFALSSASEGLPLVILEAMAAGLPIASTAVGGIPDVIEDGVTGVLAPVDERAFAAALDGLVADPSRTREMGRKGRALALGRYGADKMVDAYLELYERVAA